MTKKIREVVTQSLGYDYWETQCINGAKFELVLVATKAWLELVEHGNAWPDYVGFSGNASAIFATSDNKVISLIVYHIDPSCSKAFIDLGWTAPAYRGQGLYKRTLGILEKKLAGKVNVIESVVASGNETMEHISEEQGREVLGKIYRKRI